MRNTSLTAFFFLGAATVAACSGSNNDGLFGASGSKDGGSEAASPGDAAYADGGDGQKPCTGIACQKVECPQGATTKLTGKVYDPAGVNVLHGALVYVPVGPLAPLGKGAACDACGEIDPPPVALAKTDAAGRFTLEDVPVGKKVPLVVQIGKWRRTIEVDVDKACDENAVTDRSLRLPRNGTEGDMPHIAVTAGGCDALECLLRGIGIDDSEFVAGASTTGHVHVFAGDGGKGVAGSPSATELWSDVATMKPYDAVLLSCECSEVENKKPASARMAMHDYTELGGRVIATHFHYTWLKSAPQPDFQGIAQWNGSGGGIAGLHDVDTSTPAGQDFAQWLVNVGASTQPGKIQLNDVTGSLSRLNPPGEAIISSSGATSVPRVFSFSTPIGGQACGRFTFTDVHTAPIPSTAQVFPTGCGASGTLTAQQKALEYLFFEQSACK